MNEKKKCPNCNLSIDSDMEKCPYCGYIIPKESEIKEQKPKEDLNKESALNEPFSLTKGFVRKEDVSIKKELTLFLTSFVGINVIAFIIQLITVIFNPYFATSIKGGAFINFSVYLIVFGIFLLTVKNDIVRLISKFKKLRTYLYGISYGLLIIFVSITYNFVVSKIVGNFTSNNNENAINNIVKLYPFLSVIIFGIIGPITEELSYRLGLFSLIRRRNRTLAYLLTGLFFGLIHFNFLNPSLIELVNLPNYIISGLLLSYFYDKEGIETSIIAHCFNNLASILITILGAMI